MRGFDSGVIWHEKCGGKIFWHPQTWAQPNYPGWKFLASQRIANIPNKEKGLSCKLRNSEQQNVKHHHTTLMCCHEGFYAM